MRPLTIFTIILGVMSTILVIAGSILLSGSDTGYIILYIGLLIGIVFSITAVIDVIKSRSLNSGRRTLWLIIVFCVPVLGGLMYYLIHQRKSGLDVLSTPDYEDSI